MLENDKKLGDLQKLRRRFLRLCASAFRFPLQDQKQTKMCCRNNFITQLIMFITGSFRRNSVQGKKWASSDQRLHSGQSLGVMVMHPY